MENNILTTVKSFQFELLQAKNIIGLSDECVR